MTNCTGSPSEQWLERYLQGTLSEREQKKFEEHYFDCPVCLAQLEALQAVQIQLGSQPLKKPMTAVSPWPTRVGAFGAIAAMLIAGFAGYRTILHRPDHALIAALEDGGGQIGVNAQGELSGAPALSPEYSALLAQTLSTHRLPASPLAADTNGLDTLRGAAGPAAAFSVLSPLREETITSPAFHWQALPQAESYRVSIYDADYKLVAQSPAIQQTTWTPSGRLSPGKTYTWVVKAKTTSGIAQAPQAPAREAKFTVADASTLAAIDAARAQYPGSHLLLASLYAKAGMTSVARTELNALAQQNPGSTLVHDLSSSLDASEGDQPPSSIKPAQ